MQLRIRDTNKPLHLDVEHDIQKVGNGQFTFTVRLNNGVVTDYNVIEHIDTKQFLILKSLIIEELTLSHVDGNITATDTVWDINFHNAGT